MSTNASGNIGFESGVALGNNSPTAALFNLPTQNISRSGNINMGGNTQCLNFVGAVNATLLSATCVKTAAILFVNTSGSGPVNIKLDSGGTIGGKTVFQLASGQAASFAYDGTNFS
jgi:hypothetical protein